MAPTRATTPNQRQTVVKAARNEPASWTPWRTDRSGHSWSRHRRGTYDGLGWTTATSVVLEG